MDANVYSEPLVQREICREENGMPTLQSKILAVLQDPDYREYESRDSENTKMYHIWEEKALRLMAEIADEIKNECIYEDGTTCGGKLHCEPDVFQGYALILEVLSNPPNENGVNIIKQLFGNE